MNLRLAVDEIRAGVVRSALGRNGQIGLEASLVPLQEELNRLVVSYEQLCSMRNAVGRMPPSPNTLRVKAGSVLVRTVQRMLFWYTPQIHRFHNATAAFAENACASMEKQIAALQRLYGEIAEVRSEIRLRAAAATIEPPAATAPAHQFDPGFDDLRFSFENKLRGTPDERRTNLQGHLMAVESCAPAVPAGIWLDIGCGRGDWIGMVTAGGREAIGLDDNRVAVAHCMSAGLRAIFCDPLAYLRSSPDAEYAVISAMHILNRFPPKYAAQLIQESARALKPGGLFLLESVNPASLAAAAEGAWCDLTVLRPLPVFTAEFLLEHYGLHVVMQQNLDACPKERRLPFAELDFIRQLNDQLYSPAAYVLFARPRITADSDRNGFETQRV